MAQTGGLQHGYEEEGKEEKKGRDLETHPYTGDEGDGCQIGRCHYREPPATEEGFHMSAFLSLGQNHKNDNEHKTYRYV
ncbi:MAG: hypothetical protein WAM60_04960 [Candidatus Promineifilaceae bacterium]